MKRYMFAAALTAALACLSLPLRAEKLKATVPFNFYMDKSAMPAGDYLIDVGTQGMVTIYNTQARRSALVLTLPAERAASLTAGQLVFHRIGDEYFLNNVWLPNAAVGRQFRQSAREKEAVARTSRVTVASVPAHQE